VCSSDLFHARFLKGERVARRANFDPALITERRISLAVSCDGHVGYAERSGNDSAAQRAFYATLAERGTRRFEARGCWIAAIH